MVILSVLLAVAVVLRPDSSTYPDYIQICQCQACVLAV